MADKSERASIAPPGGEARDPEPVWPSDEREDYAGPRRVAAGAIDALFGLVLAWVPYVWIARPAETVECHEDGLCGLGAGIQEMFGVALAVVVFAACIWLCYRATRSPGKLIMGLKVVRDKSVSSGQPGRRRVVQTNRP